MNENKTYKPRIADTVLARKLAGKGAVLIEGPKWCGKTTTAEQQAKSVIYMDDPTNVKENLLKAELAPQELLQGDTPRLLDEWQIAPQLWDTIRFEADHRKGNGHFILTGSSVPVDEDQEDDEEQEESKKIRHSGTGRFGWVRMRPMALYESGESNGAVSLKELFSAPEKIYAKSPLSREDLAFVLCRGGWPGALDLDKEIALDQAFDYVESVAKKDMNRVVDKVRRNPERRPLLPICRPMNPREWMPKPYLPISKLCANSSSSKNPRPGTPTSVQKPTSKEWQFVTSGPMLPRSLARSSTTVIQKVWNAMPSYICVMAATGSSKLRLVEKA